MMEKLEDSIKKNEFILYVVKAINGLVGEEDYFCVEELDDCVYELVKVDEYGERL